MKNSFPNMQNERLPLRAKLGYAVGDFAFNLFFTTATLFLLFYYTDVLGLAPSTAGWVFAAALVWDALFDPVMGYLADHTRTRWGRYRPYILFGAIPLALSWSLIFLPVTLEGTALLVFAFGAHILFRTMYAVVGMPFLALSAVLTSDSQERGSLASYRMVFGALCGLCSAVATLKLVGVFGGGKTGFFITSLLYGALGVVILFVAFSSTQEKVLVGQVAHPSIDDVVRTLRANRALWFVGASCFIGGFSSTFFQKTLPYFFKYHLARPDLIGPALGILAGTVMLSIPVWSYVMRKSSKRTMWMVGSIMAVAVFVAMYVTPSTPLMFMTLLGCLGFSMGASFLAFWATLPDTIEYGQWRTGVRAEGAVFGLVVFIQKASLGLAAAALGEVLSLIGYRANAVQTPETLESLRVLMIVYPAVLTVCSIVIVSFYPINRRAHRLMLHAIQRRSQRKTMTTQGPVGAPDQTLP